MSQYSYPGSTSLPTSQNQQLASISNISTHPYQHDSPGPSQILPPIHPPANGIGSYHPPSSSYRHGSSAPQTPRVPHTPETPASAGAAHFSQMNQPPPLNPAEPQSSYGPVAPAYKGMNGSYGTSAPHQNGSTPSTVGTNPQQSLPHISPALFGGLHDQYNGMPRYPTHPQMPSPTQDSRSNEHRMIPVVGSQGRRGILPSAPGRPPPPGSALDGSNRNSVTPNKNSDNKYPCNYCNKTYLHLKHLKRHHLRHTGERPYQCCLCQETFCRSDILKRHFNKCSIRRGNPTGATHLTHAQAHIRPSQSAPNSATGNAPPSVLNGSTTPSVNGNSNHSPGYRSLWHPNSAGWPATNGDQAQMPPVHPGESARTSRSSSFMGRPGSSSSDDKKRFSGSSSYGHTTNGSVETSPTIAPPQERGSSFSFNHDRMHGHGQRDNHSGSFYAQGPPLTMSGQMEHNHSYPFYRSGFPQYNGATNGHMHQDSWANAFQPGGQDTMMYSTH